MRKIAVLAALLSMALVAAACGSSDSSGSGPLVIDPDPDLGESTADEADEADDGEPTGDDAEPAVDDPTATDDAAEAEPATTTPDETTTTTAAPQTTTTASPTVAAAVSFDEIDWWACWWARDAMAVGGETPADGGRVALLPNTADGSRSIGAAGDLSHPDAPIFRSAGAAGLPSIEFTFEGNTLLQTNRGEPLSGDAVIPASRSGVTVAWIGVVSDVMSHSIKYLVSGLNSSNEYPQLIVEGEGPNRFLGYAGGSTEARSSDGVIIDGQLVGVLLHLGPDSSSWLDVDGVDYRGGQDSSVRGGVVGVTVGNLFARNFSTTDHQMVFTAIYEGSLGEAEQALFWEQVAELAG